MIVETSFYERRLTSRGVELLPGRIEQLGLDGCYQVQTAESSGGVFARTHAGLVGIMWDEAEGPFGTLRRATEEEEADLARLADDLASLEDCACGRVDRPDRA